MLMETFHWDPGTLAKADVDMVLPVVSYYPHWRSKQAERKQEDQVFVDQVDWM